MEKHFQVRFLTSTWRHGNISSLTWALKRGGLTFLINMTFHIISDNSDEHSETHAMTQKRYQRLKWTIRHANREGVENNNNRSCPHGTERTQRMSWYKGVWLETRSRRTNHMSEGFGGGAALLLATRTFRPPVLQHNKLPATWEKLLLNYILASHHSVPNCHPSSNLPRNIALKGLFSIINLVSSSPYSAIVGSKNCLSRPRKWLVLPSFSSPQAPANKKLRHLLAQQGPPQY